MCAQYKLNVLVFEVPGQYDNHLRPEVQFEPVFATEECDGGSGQLPQGGALWIIQPEKLGLCVNSEAIVRVRMSPAPRR
jgi:hypothetical protein